MTRRLESERGWALVSALILLSIMMSVGLTAFAYVGAETKHSGTERLRESAFNITEGVLNAQTFLVAKNWPGSSANAFPSCSSSGTASALCPSSTQIARSYATTDYTKSSSWSVGVYDNGGAYQSFYDDAAGATRAQPGWDANGDGRVWVRAQGVVSSKRRTVAALVDVDQVIEQFPRNTITAGSFSTSNNGNKVIVDTKGSAAASAPIAVRCKVRGVGCLDYQQSKGQVSPDNVVLGLADGGQALSDSALDRLRQSAQAKGTYYATCPANPSGALVFVESGNCSYNPSAASTFNSATSPGVLVIASGTFTLGGNSEFYGLVYMANRQGSTGTVVQTQGASAIFGSVAIDGQGGLVAGSSKENIIFDDRVFGSVRSYPSGSIVPGSWREIE